MTAPRRVPGARWLGLENDLLLFGLEPRRCRMVRAFRDPLRPIIYDRHLVLPAGPPGDDEAVDRDVRALDAYYEQTGTHQWSWIGAEDEAHTPAWVDALEGIGLESEDYTLMACDACPAGWSFAVAGVERVTAESGFDAVRAVAAGEPSDNLQQRVIPLLLSLVTERARVHDVEALVVREGGVAVASITVTLPRSSADGLAWLEDLATQSEARGRGLARTLFRAATALAFAKGAKAVGLSASESDWPCRWYAREGFTVRGRALRFRRDLVPRGA